MCRILWLYQYHISFFKPLLDNKCLFLRNMEPLTESLSNREIECNIVWNTVSGLNMYLGRMTLCTAKTLDYLRNHVAVVARFIVYTVLLPSRKHAYIVLTPLNPTFIQWNWGFQGYTLICLYLLKNIDCRYSLEPPRWGGSNVYPQSMFWAEIWKLPEFCIWKFSFFFLW